MDTAGQGYLRCRRLDPIVSTPPAMNSKGAKVKSRAVSVVPPLLTQELAAASLSTNNKSKVR